MTSLCTWNVLYPHRYSKTIDLLTKKRVKGTMWGAGVFDGYSARAIEGVDLSAKISDGCDIPGSATLYPVRLREEKIFQTTSVRLDRYDERLQW